MANQAPTVSFSVDTQEAIARLRQDFRALTDSEFNRRIAATMNEMVRKARTVSNRQARSVYPAVQLKTLRAAQKDIKAGAATMEAHMVTKGRPIGIGRLQARQNKQGVSFNLKGTRMMIKGAWMRQYVNEDGDSYKLVWARGKYTRPRDKGFTFQKGGQKPIGVLKSVSVPGALMQKSVEKAYMEVLDKHFLDRAAHVLANAVARKSPRSI